jgi:hypothetical protein
LDVLEPRDLVPASVTAWESTASREYRVEFNEEVAAVDGSFSAVPALGALEVSAVGGILRIVAESDAAPGAPVAVEGPVRDASGNTTSFVCPSGVQSAPAEIGSTRSSRKVLPRFRM